ncbi:uncharacterized protein L201_005167 [Kwoniella dendrophila CBS 6074]|uniref:Uncharacterized protein n=1 Tax=Kwoniella dendrophila CBS 6074 TaxID=1295534 RepID=A0AAX4JZG4_9TREE
MIQHRQKPQSVTNITSSPSIKFRFALGKRKLEALSHVKTLTFIDRESAEKFCKLMKLFANGVYGSTKSPQVFPSVNRVSLGRPLVDVLFTAFDDLNRPETIKVILSVWIPVFLGVLGMHCKTESIAIDWPSDWSGDRDIGLWDEPGLPFAGDSFFTMLVELTKVEKILINVIEMDLLSIWLNFMEEDHKTEVIINVLVDGKEKNDTILYEVENHFGFLTESFGQPKTPKKDLLSRLTYVLPEREGLSEELDKKYQEAEDDDLFVKLAEMIIFRDDDDLENYFEMEDDSTTEEALRKLVDAV